MPNSITCSPGSWLHHKTMLADQRSQMHREQMRETANLSHSIASGTWGGHASTMRPPHTIKAELAPAGGATHGPKPMQPSSSAHQYDETKHGWHTPHGAAEQRRLLNPREEGSWSWTMGKARNHIGYGDDGMVDRRDVQGTAVSGDGPTWFVGTRTLHGPRSTNTLPVRRCPFVDIVEVEGGKPQLKIRAKTYTQGFGMSQTEVLHDTPLPPPPKTPVRDPMHPMNWDPMLRDPIARRNNLWGGCRSKTPFIPRSSHVTYESHEVPSMRTMKNMTGMAG